MLDGNVHSWVHAWWMGALGGCVCLMVMLGG